MQYSSWLCVKKPICCPFISGNKSQREELDSILFIFEVSRTCFYFCETVPFSTNSCFDLLKAELWSGPSYLWCHTAALSTSWIFLEWTLGKNPFLNLYTIIFAVGPPVCFLFFHPGCSCKSKVVCPATPVCAYIIVSVPLLLSLCWTCRLKSLTLFSLPCNGSYSFQHKHSALQLHLLRARLWGWQQIKIKRKERCWPGCLSLFVR